MSDHEAMKDLVASYVLGALPPSEESLVRSHILSCDECLAEADELDGAAAALVLDVEEVPLPAGFADRVVAAATGGASVAPQTTRTRAPGWSRLLVAASLSLAVAFGAALWSWVDTDRDLDRTERALTALLHGEDATFTLSGAGGAAARVVPRFDGAYLIAAGLREAPSDHVYQLWLMRDGEPVSAGLFDGSESISIVETDADLDLFEAAAITIEPAGGSARPTSEPILTS